jgi:TPR repeat protein
LDLTKAAEWYHLAADGCDLTALIHLAQMYAQGAGVPQDFVQAHMWSNLAAVSGLGDLAELRDALGARMIPSQVAEAQERAQRWTVTHGTPKDALKDLEAGQLGTSTGKGWSDSG